MQKPSGKYHLTDGSNNHHEILSSSYERMRGIEQLLQEIAELKRQGEDKEIIPGSLRAMIGLLALSDRRL